jgi:hypothetical protein
MPRNRLPRVMKYYSSTGRRSHGRLLDTWDRNGSTCGPTPWKIDDDDDDDLESIAPLSYELMPILMLETVCYPETSALYYQTTRCHNLENHYMNSQRCENLISSVLKYQNYMQGENLSTRRANVSWGISVVYVTMK